MYHPSYRRDIDGLRAIAVLGVVFFHAFPEMFPGGFVGVDVFFVISGYLITTIIIKSIEGGGFNFYEFYSRRARRIFPSLVIVIVFVVTIGWSTLLSHEYKQLGKYVVGGATFSSNFLLWDDTGYFDTSSETKPLLHLWSLAIEEQFYIVWPLLLYIIYKSKIKAGTLAISLLVLSFSLNIIYISNHQSMVFYLPFTRFWELLVGAAMVSSVTTYSSMKSLSQNEGSLCSGKLKKHQLDSLCSFIGISILLLGFICINEQSLFPGAWALLPVAGSALIIYSGPLSLFNRTILSNPILVWFGSISYSLYLWHWPLISFLRIVSSQTPEPIARFISVLLSVLLAWISTRYIEKLFRGGRHGNAKAVGAIAGLFFVGVFGMVIYKSNGLPTREVNQINIDVNNSNAIESMDYMVHACPSNNLALGGLASCLKDVRGNVKFAMLGDSKAASMITGSYQSSDQERWLFVGGNGPNGAPVPLVSDAEPYKEFQSLTRNAVDFVANDQKIKVVAIVAAARQLFRLKDPYLADLPTTENYEIAKSGLLTTTKIFIKNNKKVVFVVDNPTLAPPEDCLARQTSIPMLNSILSTKNPRCSISIENHRAKTAVYLQLLSEIKNLYPNDVYIFDPTNTLCDKADGQCKSIKDGRLMYSYGDHISDYASGLIGPDLNMYMRSVSK